MKEITPKELQELLATSTDFLLLDVREPAEKQVADIGGKLIPLATLPANIPEAPAEQKIVVYCRSGGRSGQAVDFLTKQAGFQNVFNLKGGILAWSDQVDPSIKKY